ncbi:hypothetical protein C8R45DRAFT_841775, partial [Mycena sanguinolenta]
FRFHGTKRACYIGEDARHLSPCNRSNCNLCGILRSGFDIKKANPGSMFGSGIYSTEISSKANNYVWNEHIRSKLHAMIMCDIVLGRSQNLYSASNHRSSPDYGYDSIEGMTLGAGGSLHQPETVVYAGEAIMPYLVIMYTRTNVS